ncbi:hypothetical protein BDD12DRAFT_896351 [Trichophaea hybrida]|nr:hypothetical protein BDD12DRAFT_896351 [Trichophaea hybrida]
MGDDNTEQQKKKRKSKWNASYFNVSISDAQKRLGFMFRTFGSQAIPVDHQREVYDLILDHLEIEGYPMESDPDFKEANVSDLVLHIISPILSDFRRKTGRRIALLREKEIISLDSETGGYEEFVAMDMISITEQNFILVIEARDLLSERR